MDNISVYIVDDEPPVIDGLKMSLSRHEAQLEITGFAYNGKEALEGILSVSPDIVLLDIQMPGMGGIETLKRLREEHYKGIVILVTAYERFDIAREAFGLEVFDYLLKPISPRKIEAPLNAAAAFVRKKRRERRQLLTLEEKFQRAQRLAEHSFMDVILSGGEMGQEYDEYRPLISLPDKGGHLVRIQKTSPGEPVKWPFLLRRLEYSFPLIRSRPLSDRVWLFCPSLPDLEQRINQALEGLSHSLDIQVSSYYPYGQLHQGFLEVAQGTPAGAFPMKKLISLLDSICEALKEPSPETLEECWIGGVQGCTRREEALFLLSALLGRLEGKVLESCSQGLMMLNRIKEDSSLSALTSAGQQLLREYYQKTQQERSYSKATQMALQIIHNRFAQPLSLEMVAEEAGVSPSYLSRLFAQELKNNFIDYLTAYRMEWAKKLLNQGVMSIKEIAPACGYPDPNYFSRIFKKITGKTPREYGKE